MDLVHSCRRISHSDRLDGPYLRQVPPEPEPPDFTCGDAIEIRANFQEGAGLNALPVGTFYYWNGVEVDDGRHLLNVTFPGIVYTPRGQVYEVTGRTSIRNTVALVEGAACP